MYDVAVIGGSLAGATLALRLGREGANVCLIDRSDFSERKPCGEGLSAIGAQFLQSLGLTEELKSLERHPFSGFTLWDESKRFEVPFAERRDSESFGVRRFDLQNVILRALEGCASVTRRFGEAISDLTMADDHAAITIADEVVRARHVVVADGANSPTAKRLGIQPIADTRDRFGLSVVANGVFETIPNTVHLLLKEGYEIYCTATGKNSLTICMLFSKLAKKIAPLALMQSAIEEAITKVGFTVESMSAPLGAAPLGSVRRPAFYERALLIGDACESFDPIAGMGMSHALASASFAAEALTKSIANPNGMTRAFEEYKRQRERFARPLRGLTRLTYFSLQNFKRFPFLRSFATGTLGRELSAGPHRAEVDRSLVGVVASSLAQVAGLSPLRSRP